MGEPKQQLSRPRIVVVGGGAGGLELVTGLGKKFGKKNKAEIILVDSSPVHIWKPLLHEVAAGTLNSYEDELSYLAYATNHYFQFCLGTMKGLNRTKKEISLRPVLDKNQKEIIPERTIPYDILVIAVGSVSNDFNITGVREHCLMIDTSNQAFYFQQHLIKTLMGLPFQSKKEDQQLNIAIVGGGATGVELTAELYYATQQMAEYGLGFDPDKISFSLIEASEQLLPALSPHLSQVVRKQLEQLKVTLYTGEQVSHVTAEGLSTKSSKFIPAAIKVWAAGIKAPDFLKELDGLEVNRINQLVVKQTLQTTMDVAIFALGDSACCPQPGSDKSVPPRAQAAHQQANFLIKNIDNFLNQKKLSLYQYHDYGSLISLSHYETVGNLMGRITKSMMIEGKLARFAYRSLYRAHQAALHGSWHVAMILLANLLTRRIKPRLKLH